MATESALTRGGRRAHKFRAGVRKYIKRKVNKRVRQGEAAVLRPRLRRRPTSARRKIGKGLEKIEPVKAA